MPSKMIANSLRFPPPLDPDFVPAAIWNRLYRESLTGNLPDGGQPLGIALSRSDGSVFTYRTAIYPPGQGYDELNLRYLERLVKFMLWQKGGSHITIAGSPTLAGQIAAIYSPTGPRAFDAEIIGQRIYGESLTVDTCADDALPAEYSPSLPLGRHLDGCRIGFDLGGSDRKCAAVIDGKVVFAEEIPWDPYFQPDPQYHYDGINDCLRRAAAQLPRVDAIGGSAAGVYVNNQVRVASLFRGVPAELFQQKVVNIFRHLQDEWNGIPFDVVNDGEVTALAGAMSLDDTAVLGIAMGTSEAAGYCDNAGHITSWLNELAFAPVDYHENAATDEWSGDRGCGVQYFSQQAIGRLVPRAGIKLASGLPLPEQLEQVQELMSRGDDRARRIYQTIGTYLGYSIAHYADFYQIKNLLILGRVSSGDGGRIIIETAQQVLHGEFPELAASGRIVTPDEQAKRHGQAIAAASLPVRQNYCNK